MTKYKLITNVCVYIGLLVFSDEKEKIFHYVTDTTNLATNVII